MKKIILLLAIAGFMLTASAQVGIGTTTPDASAKLDVTSTSQGFLPPRVANVTAVASPVAGLQVYDISNNCMRYYNGKVWSLCMGENNGGQVATTCGGKIWMDKNLGATQVATSSTDAAAYGDLYQWGRAADGHESRTSGTTTTTATSATPGHGDFILADSTTDNNWTDFAGEDNLWQGVNGINNPCPSGFRLPTLVEWVCERLSWSSNDAAGAFASPLKLPLPGWRFNEDAYLSEEGQVGFYWTSTLSTVNVSMISTLSVYEDDGDTDAFFRGDGLSVRCIKE